MNNDLRTYKGVQYITIGEALKFLGGSAMSDGAKLTFVIVAILIVNILENTK